MTSSNLPAAAPSPIWKAWVSAFRPRTLPLALASILMGAFLAASRGRFNGAVVALAALTTILLQILSNLANDYGDSQNGADSVHREGPQRAVQSGAISAAQMKQGMVVFGAASLVVGIALLWVALGFAGLWVFGTFLVLGLAAIWAAVNYTAGSRPYGYAGLGDVSVFLFFGVVGVCGTYFLQAYSHVQGWAEALPLEMLLPAASLGCFSAAVLNVNNIRDIRSDGLAGKITVPVRLGPRRARGYHWLLLLLGLGSAVLYVALTYHSPWQWLFLGAGPLLGFNGLQVWKRQESMQLDPLLKQMAMSTLLFVLLFGVGQLL
ncbi:1,4-dihydroxy-2-naphthoate polyprenyltransferase [Hymenobacter busanensis]|uniref:1,4-dihydroxy-2-naphthoate octaprenyltransferase n=1 Tax=Hymenobacter busanensis TaxID=2607656 RepID=A0A7L5A1T5_9BACT|nr:1,4-dihydroxy-2-naphthoate polyprenyltransferase [Hymenobacter busanensis]KAA9327017.1 1,4-dihydroxy-2-naphthoate polyprenyltransferase [Hymenobacter busanensis]QHJ09468.1 1,4-dihydroxy-2-naphthoate polyprenyltransferase [Hymenobacter busanensis]